MGIFGTDAAGQDAVNLFGHKIPVSMLGVAAAALGALLVLRARSTGSKVVSAGTEPSAATTYSSTSYDPDAQAIADLQSTVTQLGSTVSSLSSAAPASAVSDAPAPVVSVANAGTQEWYGVTSAGQLVTDWLTASGQTEQAQLGAAIPGAAGVDVALGSGGDEQVNVLNSEGQVVYSTTRTGAAWSGGAQPYSGSPLAGVPSESVTTLPSPAVTTQPMQSA